MTPLATLRALGKLPEAAAWHNCKTCGYHCRWGFCRRHAPRVLIAGVLDSIGEQRFVPQTVFPAVNDADWCGEWSERKEGEA